MWEKGIPHNPTYAYNYYIYIRDEKKKKGDLIMTITVNTNLASLTIQRNLTKATNGMNTAMERMSTGYRINKASDDAAGMAVSTKMQAQISGISVAESNASMGISVLQTQEGILDIVNGYLQRIRDLTEQAANGTYATDSLYAIRTEVEQRMNEINRLCEVTEFNGIALLSGEGPAADDGINLQVGMNSTTNDIITLDKDIFASSKCSAILGLAATNANPPGNIDLTSSAAATTDNIYEATTASSNVVYCKSALTAAMVKHQSIDGTAGGLTIAGTGAISISQLCDAVYDNDNAAREFLNYVDGAIANITGRVTNIGAYTNRVNSAISALDVINQNLESANSSIQDADIAVESSNFLKYQILQQSAATLLTTANQSPSIALNLI